MNTTATIVQLQDGTFKATLANHSTGARITFIAANDVEIFERRRKWELQGCPNEIIVTAYTMQEYKERLARCPSDSEGVE